MNLQYVFSQTAGVFYEVGYYVTSLNILVLVLVTIGAFALRRFWCRLCPLGGLIAVFNRFIPFKRASVIRLNKEEEKCTKCGICKRVCPPQVTEVYEEKGGDVTASGCILCFRCVEMCPYEDCLKIDAVGKSIYKSQNWLNPTK
jgi:polyferredoxin